MVLQCLAGAIVLEMEATDGVFVDFEEHDGTPLAEDIFSTAEDEFFGTFDVELDEIDTGEMFGLRISSRETMETSS